MNVRTMAVMAAVVLCGCVATSQAVPYTWVGPTNGDWLAAASWSGTPAFVNDPANVCDVNSGGTPSVTTSGAAFQGRLNVNSGASVTQQGYKGTTTIGSLHLVGGTLRLGASGNVTVTGGISVDANGSQITALQNDNNSLNAAFSGSGNALVTNNQPSGRSLSMNVSNSSGYGGVMTLAGSGYYNVNGSMGGTIHINSTPSGVNCNAPKATYGVTPTNWELDLNGKALKFGIENNEQGGVMTLLSNAVIQSTTDYAGKYTTLSGKITGAGKLTLYSNSTRGTGVLALIVNSSLNDYSGGTLIKGGPTEARVAHSLGTGNVEVDPGAVLQVSVSDVMDAAASLYLDFNSALNTFGKLSLAAGSVTTVTGAYVDGTGGWAAPVGYTALTPGTYTSANLGSYITGAGTLVVVPEPVTMGLLMIGGLVAGWRVRRHG